MYLSWLERLTGSQIIKLNSPSLKTSNNGHLEYFTIKSNCKMPNTCQNGIILSKS